MFFLDVCFILVTLQKSLCCLFYLCFKLPMLTDLYPLPIISLSFFFLTISWTATHSQTLFDFLRPLSFSLPCYSPCVLTSRVNLDPSKRQGSNKSVSGCTLPQGSKTVSKFPCLQLYACLLPVSLHVCLSWHLACPYVPFEILPVNRMLHRVYTGRNRAACS